MLPATERAIIEIHRGHSCETWRLLLDDVGRRAIARVDHREWALRHGTKQMVPGGHEFMLDERGAVDFWRMDTSHHNGPECAACRRTFCEHCHPEVYAEMCDAVIPS